MLKTLDFDNLQGERRYKPFLAYAVSKLANVLFTYELDRRLAGSGVTANWVHPGVVRTGIWGASRGFIRLLTRLAEPFMLSASDPALAGISACYFLKDEPVRSSPVSYDKRVATRLWETSAALVATALR